MINDQTVNGFMKAMYISPKSEVEQITSFATMQAISGPAGLKDGGKDDGHQEAF